MMEIIEEADHGLLDNNANKNFDFGDNEFGEQLPSDFTLNATFDDGSLEQEEDSLGLFQIQQEEFSTSIISIQQEKKT